jgi:GGDEF domain-containing protein
VAKFDPQDDAKDIDKMLVQADRALYEEKRKKNRILLN